MSFNSFKSPVHGQGMNPIPWLQFPARIDAKQTADVLGCQEHDIPVLVQHGLLEPLGKPAPKNARKYFASLEVLALAQDRAWLGKATRTLYLHWQGRIAARTKGQPEGEAIAA